MLKIHLDWSKTVGEKHETVFLTFFPTLTRLKALADLFEHECRFFNNFTCFVNGFYDIRERFREEFPFQEVRERAKESWKS